jgi:putative glycosyltransferase (TIGR04348 family)
MRISLITPAAPRARTGNRHTAARWARMLRGSGHQVKVRERWDGADADIMIALHARRSGESIARFAQARPERPLVVVLTGTDVYRDIRVDADARRSLALATRLVVLQEAALGELAPEFHAKVRVIHQSARHHPALPRPPGAFEVAVCGHLREEKDPFCAVRALAHVPRTHALRVTHAGRALSEDMAHAARAHMREEPRYRWLGELAHREALRLLARSALLVVSSRMEGGANVICEALAAGVPVIASRVSGNIGMLGSAYPGYYELGEARALAELMMRAESDGEYYERLQRACAERAPLFTPERERSTLAALVEELAPALARTAPAVHARR